jgi:N-acetylglucosaminyldiphosphoundecaprenol N-acetyl-beta-D-mannosaminyltransferase
MKKTNDIHILGAKINDLSLNEVINKIDTFLLTNKKDYIVTPNPEICLISYRDKKFRRIIQESLLAIPDGFGLKLVSLIWGRVLKNTTTGIDLSWQLLNHAEQNNYSILFFEGSPSIGERALKVIKSKHPKLQISFIDPGKVNNKGKFENQNLIQEINNIEPDIILVNLGAPKQEYFISNNINELNTKLMLGVGGSLDFIAGRIKRAPFIFRKLGLEWLWRLFQEPSRWPRIANAVIIFPLTCVFFKLQSKLIYRKNVAGFIINSNKQILLTKHAENHYWQLPQGGAKNAKSKKELSKAIFREMQQELGTNKFEILEIIKNCYKYKWPQIDTEFDHFKGQKQTLFLLKFTGEDNEIRLDPHEHSAWQWVNKNEIMNLIPEFKKPLITIALRNFKKYI